jgi:hypothetical protein
MAEAVKMDFEVENRDPFDVWFMGTRGRLKELAAIVNKAAELEKIQGQPAMPRNAAEHVVELLNVLSSNKLEVCEHTIRAREYYQIKLASLTATEFALKWTTSKKTVFDFVVKFDFQEKRVVERLESMLLTIESRAIIGQSILKYLHE